MNKKFTSLDITSPVGHLLYDAFKKLRGGKSWIKGDRALDKHGSPVAAESCHAASWNVYGTLRATINSSTDLADNAYDTMVDALPAGCLSLVEFNDRASTQWSDIRKWFGRAIIFAEDQYKLNLPKAELPIGDITVTSKDFRHLKIGDKSFKWNGSAYEAADGQIVHLTGIPRPPFEEPKPPPGPNRKQRRAARSKRVKNR